MDGEKERCLVRKDRGGGVLFRQVIYGNRDHFRPNSSPPRLIWRRDLEAMATLNRFQSWRSDAGFVSILVLLANFGIGSSGLDL
jgi:hypothetical protein